MKLQHIATLLFILPFLFSCSISRKKTEPPKPTSEKPKAAKVTKEKPKAPPTPPPLDWSYTGQNGPQFWGDINSKYVMCKIGKLQSPINLKWSKPKTGGNIQTFYKTSGAKIELIGNHFRLQLDPGNRVVIRGQDYDLKYVEIHSPSEHSLSSSRTSLEIQLVHHNNSGQTAILSSFVIEGKEHPTIAKLLSLTSTPSSASMMIKINPENFLPQIKTHYHYIGSVTSPPCFEGVNWNVFNTPITMSREQILTYRSTFKDNARPLQPHHNRPVTNY